MKRNFLILISFIFIISIASVSAAEDLNQSAGEILESADGGTFADLQKKIDEAPEGSLINLENDYVSGESWGMSITKSLTINGNGHTIDAEKNGQIFKIECDNVALKNITFINAYLTYHIPPDYSGAAIHINANNSIIQDCIFMNNSVELAIGSGFGGAISSIGNMTVINSYFESNDVYGDVSSNGGAIDSYGNLNLVGSKFISNKVKGTQGNGAAVYCNGHLTVNDCSFEDNTLSCWDDTNGGAIYCNGNMEVLNSNFISNGGHYTGTGGAIYSTGTVNVSDSNFIGNSLSGYYNNGGAIYAREVNANNSVFMDNYVKVDSNPYDFSSYPEGGAIFTEKANIHDCVFINNSASNSDENLNGIGGAISAHDITNIENSYFINNTADEGEALWTYEAVASINNCTFINNNYTLVNASFEIDAPELVKYYHGPERFTVRVTTNDTAIPYAQVTFSINGVDYYRVSDEDGNASMAINLNSGEYDVIVKYEYYKVNSTITVKPTVSGENITKIFRNGTQYYATFVDSEGNRLANNTEVEFNINGVFYKRYTNENGTARLNINLNPGEYIITAKNPDSIEQYSNIITVLPSIVENNDLTKYYRNDSQYSVRILGEDGNPVGANVSVKFNINGVFYTRYTNESGYVKMNINLEPGEYIITAEYNGLMASNKIKVLSVIETDDLTMRYRDGSMFNATILDGQGNPYSDQNVTFNINGIFYEKTTDENGVAHLNINLMAGEYIITSNYNGMNSANKVTVSS